MSVDENDLENRLEMGDAASLWEDGNSFDEDDDMEELDYYADPFMQMMSRTTEVAYAIGECRGVKLDDALSYDFIVYPSGSRYVSFWHPSRQEARQELYLRQTNIVNMLEAEDLDEETREALTNNLRIITEDLPWAKRHRYSCDMMMKYRALDAVSRGDMAIEELPPGVLEGLEPYEDSCEGTGPLQSVRDFESGDDLAERVARVLES